MGILFPVLLSGCVENEKESDGPSSILPASPQEGAGSESSDHEDADALDAGGANGTSAEPPKERVTIERHGSLPAAFWLVATGAAVGSGEPTSWHIRVNGTVLFGNLTLTWTAQTASTESLKLGFGPPAKNGSAWPGERSMWTEGPSPLVLAIAEAGWGPGEYALAASWADDDAPVRLYLDQPFDIAGEVVLKPAAS